jgi:hypothetical protein
MTTVNLNLDAKVDAKAGDEGRKAQANCTLKNDWEYINYGWTFLELYQALRELF